MMNFYDFNEKHQNNHLPGGLKNEKINYLFRNDDFFIENMKTESRNPHGGAWNPVLWATCPGMPGGARTQYIDRYIMYIYTYIFFYIYI